MYLFFTPLSSPEPDLLGDVALFQSFKFHPYNEFNISNITKKPKKILELYDTVNKFQSHCNFWLGLKKKLKEKKKITEEILRVEFFEGKMGMMDIEKLAKIVTKATFTSCLLLKQILYLRFAWDGRKKFNLVP